MNKKLQIALRAATVGTAVLTEKARPPALRTAHDVPLNGVDLNVDWLTIVLCKDVPGAEVVSWSNPGGSSGTSERAALRVEYNAAGQAAGLPTQLYTKSTPAFRQRMILGAADGLHGETRFFMDFRPSVTMEAASGYWGGVDDRSWRSMVIMEDIAATRGARFVDATEPLTRVQVEDVLSNLAALHGAWWDAPELQELRDLTQHIDNIATLINFNGRCKVGIERAKDVMPTSLVGQADRLAEGTLRSLQMLTRRTPTLLHGDCHVGQTYIAGDGRMGLTDWQLLMRGGWSFDVAYFVATACEPADRRAWEGDLLRHYLDRLAAAGAPAPTFDEAWLTYRQSMFYPNAAWTFTIGRAAYQPVMQSVATCKAIVHRTSHAIIELDSFEALGI